jgi:Family of unknown function (DUF6502)
MSTSQAPTHAQPVWSLGNGPGEDPMPALRTVLAPLIEWAISQGVPHGEFDQQVRELFVLAAQEAGADTVSALHLHTGLHRREIGRLVEKVAQSRNGQRREPHSIPALVLAAWTGPAHVDRRGKPKPLPRLRSQGGEASFEALVQSISLDVRPRSLLDMWITLKMVELDEQDRVRLRIFDVDRPALSNPVPQAERVSLHLGTYARVVLGNVMGKTSVSDLTVLSPGLSAESATALNKQWMPKLFALLQRMNADVTAAEAADTLQGRTRDHTLQLGTYFVTDPLLPSMHVKTREAD